MGRSRVALSGLLVAFAVSATPAAAQFFGFPAAPHRFTRITALPAAYTPQYQNRATDTGTRSTRASGCFPSSGDSDPASGRGVQRQARSGTIVVSTEERRLYYVLGNGKAIAYGVGVGARASNGPAPSPSP
jgi:lipoprotein-anchoring transpeptidase ErfK/SrfK